MNEVRLDYANNDELRSVLGGLQVGKSAKITGLEILISRNDENGLVGTVETVEVETEDGGITTEPDVDSAVDLVIAAIETEPEDEDEEDERDRESDEGESYFAG